VKFLKQGLCLAVIGAGLAALPGLQATAAAPSARTSDGSLVQQIRDGAEGGVTFSAERATGKVSFIRAGLDGDLLPSAGNGAANPAGKASAFLDRYAGVFGAGRAQLVQDRVTTNSRGTSITYVQRYQGLPVFGAMLKAQIDAGGDLTSVNGTLVPVSGLSTQTRITRADAGRRAVELVTAEPPTAVDGQAADTRGLAAKAITLEVYRMGLTQGRKGGANVLAYQVEVTNDANVRDMVFVSATTGKILNRYTMVDDALSRELYEAVVKPTGTDYQLVWSEGDPLPGSLNADQASMVESTGDAYWLFKNTFGRDSYDGAGAVMRTINNDPRIDCPNANWNGQTTNYCDGVSSDDVVAHEWGHAYTEYTDGLIYQWQSGALNEAYSDIWGETVDLINSRLDEDEGDLAKKRPVGQCSTHSPANPVLTINAPAAIAKDCATAGASFGPQLSGTGVTGDVVMGLDVDENSGQAGDEPTNPFDLGGSIYDGCSTIDNAAAVAGHIVMLNRGLCGFEVKARNAEAAGATAVIIGNRNEGEVFAMAGDIDPDPTISAVMIDKVDRTSIATALEGAATVNVTMKDASGDRVDSFRWLIGEDSSAFGGAIRDMWSPTCYGDPGKVSDAEYKCSADDNGGVHGNSGVVNHAYALLVDGGTYNGITVSGLGFDKAANIFFTAQTQYLTPISDFPDLADSLEASCTSLVGKAIGHVSVTPNNATKSFNKITTDDCAQVHAMTRAVDLRVDPTSECGWKPLLDPHAPAACGADFKGVAFYSEDFESGLGDWTLSGENPFGGPTYDWKTTSVVPGGHESTVALGPDPDEGDCSGDVTDISSANYLDSGDIVVPQDAQAPRLTFDHYIATETGYDGGNLQLSVNGGAFAPVAKAAYSFNGPGKLASVAEQSTNPLAGEDGFTGTNPGSPFGSWGQSQVDLAAAGVVPGDTVKLRFAMGRDGCGGVDGWYVDNVTMVSCVEKVTATVSGVVAPSPVAYGTARKLTVTVTGSSPTGLVTVKEGATVRGTITLAGGTGQLALSTKLPVGAHTFSLAYSGDGENKAATGSASLTVTKAATTTTATAPTSVKFRANFKVATKVTAVGATPTGTVKVFMGTTLLGKGTLVGGKVTITVTRDIAVGKHTLVVKYLGSANFGASQKKLVLTVTR